MTWRFIDGHYHITLSATSKRRIFANLSDGLRWAYITKMALQVASEWEMKA